MQHRYRERPGATPCRQRWSSKAVVEADAAVVADVEHQVRLREKPTAAVAISIANRAIVHSLRVGIATDVGVGVAEFTVRQLGATPLPTLVTVTLAEVFVNAAGPAPQLALTWPDALVTFTATVHDDAPAGTCKLVTVIVPLPATAVVA